MKGKDLDSDNVKAELVTVDCKNNSIYGLSILIDEFVKKKHFVTLQSKINVFKHQLHLEYWISDYESKKCSSNKHLNQLWPKSMNKIEYETMTNNQ